MRSDPWSHYKGDDLQEWATAHDIKWRFHLPHDPHLAGLIGKENEILKQQIKSLTGKTTSAGWTKILFQALTHLNDQPVGPVAPDARPGTPAKVPNTVKLWKTDAAPH